MNDKNGWVGSGVEDIRDSGAEDIGIEEITGYGDG